MTNNERRTFKDSEIIKIRQYCSQCQEEVEPSDIPHSNGQGIRFFLMTGICPDCLYSFVAEHSLNGRLSMSFDNKPFLNQ